VRSRFLLIDTASVALALFACSATPPAPPPKPASPPSAGPSAASYCERLQPLLDRAVRAARIGTELTCLDMPNVTALGWYGAASAGEEAALADCFSNSADYDALLHPADSSFELAIDEAFKDSFDAAGGARLTTLVPWLPAITASASRESRISARISIKDARFVTLVGVASKLQGQPAEQRCLTSLCKAETTYVHKALIGTPTVTIDARDQNGKALEVDAFVAKFGFQQKVVAGGSRELSSEKPVTLAIARSAFRSPLTERLCNFCGREGQGCCKDGLTCDGGLGCIDGRCMQIGGPGQPCDGFACSGGATCVSGQCQVACGGRGQPCCAGSECSGKLRCTADPSNAIEHGLRPEETEMRAGYLGTDEDVLFGTASCGALQTRARFAVTKLGSGRGNCDKSWWFDPKNERDCRVSVHFDVATFGAVKCRVETFVYAPKKPDLCQ
jgi:hypothetical protein